jgi:hypothetical protein
VTGYVFAVGAWRAACHQLRSLSRPSSCTAFSPDLKLDAHSRCFFGSGTGRRTNSVTAKPAGKRAEPDAYGHRRGTAAHAEDNRAKTQRAWCTVWANTDGGIVQPSADVGAAAMAARYSDDPT